MGILMPLLTRSWFVLSLRRYPRALATLIRRNMKSNKDERDPNPTNHENALRMETLFELIILDHRVFFQEKVNIHWGREAENMAWMNTDVRHLFGRLMMTFDIVVSTQTHRFSSFDNDQVCRNTEPEFPLILWMWSYAEETRPRQTPRPTKQIVHLEIEQPCPFDESE